MKFLLFILLGWQFSLSIIIENIEILKFYDSVSFDNLINSGDFICIFKGDVNFSNNKTTIKNDFNVENKITGITLDNTSLYTKPVHTCLVLDQNNIVSMHEVTRPDILNNLFITSITSNIIGLDITTGTDTSIPIIIGSNDSSLRIIGKSIACNNLLSSNGILIFNDKDFQINGQIQIKNITSAGITSAQSNIFIKNNCQFEASNSISIGGKVTVNENLFILGQLSFSNESSSFSVLQNVTCFVGPNTDKPKYYLCLNGENQVTQTEIPPLSKLNTENIIQNSGTTLTINNLQTCSANPGSINFSCNELTIQSKSSIPLEIDTLPKSEEFTVSRMRSLETITNTINFYQATGNTTVNCTINSPKLSIPVVIQPLLDNPSSSMELGENVYFQGLTATNTYIQQVCGSEWKKYIEDSDKAFLNICAYTLPSIQKYRNFDVIPSTKDIEEREPKFLTNSEKLLYEIVILYEKISKSKKSLENLIETYKNIEKETRYITNKNKKIKRFFLKKGK